MIETGLKYWDAATNGVVASEAVARLLAAPGCSAALRHSVGGALKHFDADPKTSGLFLDIGSFALGILALYLDATGGISHRHLREISQSSSILSAGRASAILATLRFKGFAVREQGGLGDVRYRPAPLLMRHFHGRFRVELEALVMVEPDVARLVERWDEPRLFERFIAYLGAELVRAGTRPIPELDGLNRIGARRAGLLVLYQLMLSADDGEAFPRDGVCKIAITATSRRFNLSRSHVLTVIRSIEHEGLIRRASDAGEAVLLPSLVEFFPRYWAISQVAMLACAHRVLSDGR